LGSGLFEPEVGNSFDLFRAETITGDFHTLALANFDAELNWQFDLLTDFIGRVD